MIINKIINLILNKNFKYVKGNIPNLHLLINNASEEVLNVCMILDHTNNAYINPDILTGLQSSVEQKFLFNGYRKVSSFIIVLSDNIERDKVFLNYPFPFWIVDTIGKRIIIFDNQPDDYYHIKAALEQELTSSSKTAGFRSLPITTISLIAINIIIFMCMSLMKDFDYLLQKGASYWKLIYENHEYYRLITCMFLHFSSEHIMNNMLTLAFIGAETEKNLGHFRFLCIYLLSGLGASIMSSLYYMNNFPDKITFSAGASGAIFGVLGALIILTLLSKKQRQSISIHPFNLILIVVLSISNGYLNSSIDNVAHIGGLLFGIILTFISCLYRKNILK